MPLVVDSVQTDGSVPVAPAQGQIWYDASTDKVMVHKTAGDAEIPTVGSAGGGGLVQTVFVDKLTDSTTNSTAWTDLLTANIATVAGTMLDIAANLSFSCTGGGLVTFMRVLVDGVVLRGAAETVASTGAYGSMTLQVRGAGLAAGAHVVKLQWRVSANTTRCRPVANPDGESASLLVSEVSA